MELSLTRTIKLNIETKKEFCDINQQKIECIYINGKKLAEIRAFKDRYEKRWYEAKANENFIATVYDNQFGLRSRFLKVTKTKKEFYGEIERAVTDWFNKI